jgi:hypothetical protein
MRLAWASVLWLGLACFIATAGEPDVPPEAGLSGTWAQLKVLSDSVTFPLVGELARTSTLLQRVTIAQLGDSLSLAAAYCSSDFDNGPALTTVVDQAFVSALGVVTAEASVSASGSATRFTQPPSTELHGVRLENPETDPLPTSADDPRVFDQDGDGKPGITVHACAFGAITGDVYVVERLCTRLEGQVVSPDRIEGRIVGTVEQVILGATNALFLGSILSRPDPVSAHSYFILQRVSPAWVCGDLPLRRADLFGD